MAETYNHNPQRQSIVKGEHPFLVNPDHSPLVTFRAYDTAREVASADEFKGEFLTYGAADFVLGIEENIRASRKMRGVK